MAQVIKGAEELADQIMAAYDAYHEALMDQGLAAARLRTADMDLEATQDAIRLSGRLDGKNEVDRATQLRGFAEEQYLAHREAENRYQDIRLRVTDRYELLRTLRALSSLLSGTSHA